MKLIVTSSEDNASMNIRARLLEKTGWTDRGEFDGNPALVRDDFLMVQVNKIHLDEDYVDDRVKQKLGKEVEVVIFASRHRAESKIPTLSVHPIGNYSSAYFGGMPRTLCKSSPQLMTSALRALALNAKGMGFNVSFETTHHGPTVNTPAFYIEIGSYEELWGREDAAEAIAKSIMSVKDEGHPVVVCAGGGHYAPRFTEVALSKKVAIGHMAANYALDHLDENMIRQISEKSGGAEKVYFHRKGMPKAAYRTLKERFATRGLEEISSNDLEPLGE
ncbi:MAG: D-aminoacyl-tRNA deacylase [Candidatus Thermoplasmatota archaeon]|nr:D-aminoacyl-tRNA deacylase [Candidatus Thermoplasmatota archaeon]